MFSCKVILAWKGKWVWRVVSQKLHSKTLPEVSRQDSNPDLLIPDYLSFSLDQFMFSLQKTFAYPRTMKQTQDGIVPSNCNIYHRHLAYSATKPVSVLSDEVVTGWFTRLLTPTCLSSHSFHFSPFSLSPNQREPLLHPLASLYLGYTCVPFHV